MRSIRFALLFAAGAAGLSALLIGDGLNLHSPVTGLLILFNFVPYSVTDWITGPPYFREKWWLISSSAIFWGLIGFIVAKILETKKPTVDHA